LEQVWSFGSRENNIFPAFPVLRQILICRHTTSPPKPSTKVGFSRNFESRFASTPSPSTNGEVRTSLNNFGALVLEKYHFPCFPRHPNNSQFIIKLPLHRKLPRKSDLQGILKVFLPGRPALSPMERYIQVGTILELWFWRNIIFPAFPVIPTIPNLSSNCLSTESFRESRIFKEF